MVPNIFMQAMAGPVHELLESPDEDEDEDEHRHKKGKKRRRRDKKHKRERCGGLTGQGEEEAGGDVADPLQGNKGRDY